MESSITEERWLVPVSVADFQVVLFAIITFEDIELSDVEYDAFTVSSRDPPLAALALIGYGCHLEWWWWERRFVILERPPTSCRECSYNYSNLI